MAELQRLLALADEKAKFEACRQCLLRSGLPPRQCDLLALIAAYGSSGSIAGQAAILLDKSVAWSCDTLATLGCGRGRSRYQEAIRELEAIGLVAVDRVTEPHTLALNVERFRRLEPPDPPIEERLAKSAVFDPEETLAWAPPALARGEAVPIRTGSYQSVPKRTSAPSVAVAQENKKSVVRGETTDHGTTDFKRAETTATEETGTDWYAPVRREWAMPWGRRDGVTDRELRHYVRRNDLTACRALYKEATRVLRWWGECEDTKLRFLALCHHCATDPEIRWPMRVLTAQSKKGLDTSGVRDASRDWAAKMAKQKHQIQE